MAPLDGEYRYQTGVDLSSPATHTDGFEVTMADAREVLRKRVLELEEEGKTAEAVKLNNVLSVLINDYAYLIDSYRLSFPPNCCVIVDK